MIAVILVAVISFGLLTSETECLFLMTEIMNPVYQCQYVSNKVTVYRPKTYT